ncbi:MAG TPA: LCP family protein [Bacillota bacterium]|nr:LCP family protein [Bacillota bacterium]
MRSDKYKKRNAAKAAKEARKSKSGRRKYSKEDDDFFAGFDELDNDEPIKTKKSSKKARRRGGKTPTKRKKTVKTVIICLVLLLLALSAGAYIFMTHKLSKMDYVDTGSVEWCIDDRVAEELKDYRNFAVLGVDARDMESYDGSNNDAIIIVSLNKKTDKIKMISVMRDSYLLVDKKQQDDLYLTKITHAHAIGGGVWTCRALNRNLDLNIEEFAIFNWKAVADLVDAVGGVTVEVEGNEINDFNHYGQETAEKVGGTFSAISYPGEYDLDGIQAATYCRIRKTSGGDSQRAERMKKVMTAIFKKAKTMDLSTLNNIADEMLPEIRTNIKSGSMLKLMAGIKGYELNGNEGFPYKYAGGMYHGGWYAVPQTLKSNVKELHKKAFKQKKYRPTQTVREINEMIINDTGVTLP